jgi:hypothetical protein
VARLWHALANLALAAAATLVALTAVEVWLRWQGAFEMQATPGCYVFSDNPRLMYEVKPQCEGTNALGMKDDEIDPNAPGERLAALGDSITYGPGAAVHETWPKRLQQMLARAGTLATVYNFGVQGYSTVQEVETLRLKALPLRPRIVLLQYFRNDEEVYTVIFNAIIDDLRRRGQEGYLDALDPRHGWLVRRLLLTRTAIAVRVALAHQSAPRAPERPEDNVINSYYREHSPVREGLTALREIAAAHDLKVLVLVFPHSWGASDRAGGVVERELTAWPNSGVFDTGSILPLCRELGFTCVDVAAQMYARPRLRTLPGARLFSDACCHLLPFGHKIMAWVVLRELLALGWLGEKGR